MRCYFVNVSGDLSWPLRNSDVDLYQPTGVSALRYVLASNEATAVAKVIGQVEVELAKKFGWDFSINPIADWSVDEVRRAMHLNLLRRKYGFIFSKEG